jgi:hypothetical protein
MRKFIYYPVSAIFLCTLSSSECSLCDEPDVDHVIVNEYDVNIPSEGGEFVFECQSSPYWSVKKYLIINGNTEDDVYPTPQTCDDVCTYSNEWVTITIPTENKNHLLVQMKPFYADTVTERRVKVELKVEDGTGTTISAYQYSSNSPTE